MRAMILAAGRGERMGSLTANVPKPLLHVGEYYLIDYAIYNLKRAGVQEIVINVFYRGEQIKQALGNGERYGVQLIYSEEKERLDTGGGIQKALPLLGDEPFIIVSADVVTDYPLANLSSHTRALAHLVVVENPPFHPQGDFGLNGYYIDLDAKPTWAFANIGIYHPQLFAGEPGCFPWRKFMFKAIENRQVSGEIYSGLWYNVGTPQDLADVNQRLSESDKLNLLK